MFKNILLIVLTVLLLLFALVNLGVFQYNTSIEQDFRLEKITERKDEVNSGKEYKFVVVYISSIAQTRYAIDGLKDAVSYINTLGGIQGKKITLEVHAEDFNKHQYLSAIQKYCTPIDVAVCIAPFTSANVPSVRTLTHFAGVPLLSPVTIRSEKLPELQGDNYVSLYPDLDLLSSSLLKHIRMQHYKKMLIITPERGSYGDITGTNLERLAMGNKSFDWIYRVYYRSPLIKEDIELTLKNQVKSKEVDAVFFGGYDNEFIILKEFLEKEGMAVPIYGTDDLQGSIVENSIYGAGVWVPTPKIKNVDHKKFRDWLNSNTNNKHKSHYLYQYGSFLIFMISDSLEANDYSPDILVNDLSSKIHDYYYKGKDKIKVEVTRINKN